MRAAISLALPLLVAAAPQPLIDRYGNGGVLRSPDGQWYITAKHSPGPDDHYAPAVAYLHGPDIRPRAIPYSRLLDAHWTADGRHVLLSLIDLDGDTLRVLALRSRETWQPDRIGKSIELQIQEIAPFLEAVEQQRLGFAQRGLTDCVLVEQDGIPRGRRTGSYVTRRAAFRLDLARNRAVRIAHCRGAVTA